LELLALPPARFQLPSSLELPVIPSRPLRALLKRILPLAPRPGAFLFGANPPQGQAEAPAAGD